MRKATLAALMMATIFGVSQAQTTHKRPAAKTTAIPSPKQDQKAKEAVLALEKLESTIESGVGLQDYSKALAEANFPVKMYLTGDSAPNFPELSKSIEDAVKWYRAARSVWLQGVTTDFPIGYCSKWPTPIPAGAYDFLLADAPRMSTELCTSFPELVTTEPDSRHYGIPTKTVTENRQIIRFDDAQQKAWKFANLALINAEQLMK